MKDRNCGREESVARIVYIFIHIVLLSICVLGCGYHLAGSTTSLPKDVRRIYIDRIENLTSDIILTPIMNQAIRDYFDRFGAVEVVDNPAIADATLSVKILKTDRGVRSVTSNTARALEYDTIVTIAGELRKADGKLLWANPKLVARKGFSVTSSTVVTSSAEFTGGNISEETLANLDTFEVSRGQEREAFIAAAEEVAKEIYEDAIAADF